MQQKSSSLSEMPGFGLPVEHCEPVIIDPGPIRAILSEDIVRFEDDDEKVDRSVSHDRFYDAWSRGGYRVGVQTGFETEADDGSEGSKI